MSKYSNKFHISADGEEEELSLNSVKKCIGFESGTNTHRILSGICDNAYSISISRGWSDRDSSIVALNALSDAINTIPL